MELDEYMREIPAERKDRFRSIVEAVRSIYPDADASMKYKMPTFTNDQGWVAVANQKNYISLYTCSAQHLESFKEKHPRIKTGKGCINFRDKDDIPIDDLLPVIRSAMEFRH